MDAYEKKLNELADVAPELLLALDDAGLRVAAPEELPVELRELFYPTPKREALMALSAAYLRRDHIQWAYDAVKKAFEESTEATDRDLWEAGRSLEAALATAEQNVKAALTAALGVSAVPGSPAATSGPARS
jgi:hypothetical protein